MAKMASRLLSLLVLIQHERAKGNALPGQPEGQDGATRLPALHADHIADPVTKYGQTGPRPTCQRCNVEVDVCPCSWWCPAGLLLGQNPALNSGLLAQLILEVSRSLTKCFGHDVPPTIQVYCKKTDITLCPPGWTNPVVHVLTHYLLAWPDLASQTIRIKNTSHPYQRHLK